MDSEVEDYTRFTGVYEESIYRERARLVAFLTKIYPSYAAYNANVEQPDWPFVFVLTQEGQLSWQIAPEDMDLFGHLQFMEEHGWDGHTTEEKYERLARLGKRGRRNPAALDSRDSLYESFRKG